jgi:hypothetical protein
MPLLTRLTVERRAVFEVKVERRICRRSSTTCDHQGLSNNLSSKAPAKCLASLPTPKQFQICSLICRQHLPCFMTQKTPFVQQINPKILPMQREIESSTKDLSPPSHSNLKPSLLQITLLNPLISPLMISLLLVHLPKSRPAKHRKRHNNQHASAHSRSRQIIVQRLRQ